MIVSRRLVDGVFGMHTGLSPFGAHTLGRLFQRFHVYGLSSASKRSSRIAATLLEFFYEARGTSGPLAA